MAVKTVFKLLCYYAQEKPATLVDSVGVCASST